MPPAQNGDRQTNRFTASTARSTLALRMCTILLFQGSDFFDPDDMVQVKYEMLRQVHVDNQPVSQAAREFGFSRPSFYQANSSFAKAGLAGLAPLKRGPRRAATNSRRK